MLLGQIPFAGSTAAQGVDQAQALVEFRVCAGSSWGTSVERLEELAPSLAFRVGPDGDRVVSGLDEFREGWSGVGRRHAPGHAPADGRKGIAGPVQHELEQGVAIWLAVCQKRVFSRIRGLKGRFSPRSFPEPRGLRAMAQASA